MNKAFRSHVAAALLLLPVSAAFVAQPVAAQGRSASSIFKVGVRAPGGLGVNETVFVTVFASPAARSAYVTLGGGLAVALQENAPGEYSGSRVIAPGDRIDPRAAVVARLQWDDGIRTASGSFSGDVRAMARDAQAGRPDRPDRPDRPSAAAPTIQRFTVSPGNRVSRGSTLRFTVTGQARNTAGLDIPGVVKDIPLRETRPGTYEGSYTVRPGDDLGAFDKAIATLSRGDQRTTAELALRAGDDRPRRDTRPDGSARPDRENRPDRDARPWRENRPDGEYRRNRDGMGNREGRNPQVAP
ncbi:MAG TPA: hypothetical protein VIL30_04380 [Ramlibacter sp.]